MAKDPSTSPGLKKKKGLMRVLCVLGHGLPNWAWFPSFTVGRGLAFLDHGLFILGIASIDGLEFA